MEKIINAPYSAILATVIVASVVAIFNLLIGHLKNRAEHDRELVKLAKELALADLEDARERRKDNSNHKIRPTSSYVWFYFRFLKIIDKDDFDTKRIKKHLDDYGNLLDIYTQHSAHQEKQELENNFENKTPQG